LVSSILFAVDLGFTLGLYKTKTYKVVNAFGGTFVFFSNAQTNSKKYKIATKQKKNESLYERKIHLSKGPHSID